MDYEKEYKSLVAKVKKAHQFAQTESTKSVLEDILPELRESEDARARKAALEGIEYLERKLGWDAIGDTDILDVKEYLEKQKEQKSALIPERIHPKFAVGDKVCRPMWSDHTIREIYVRCNDPVYVCVNEEGKESHISFSEQDEWERKEQKQKPRDYCSVRDEFDLDGNLKQKPASFNEPYNPDDHEVVIEGNATSLKRKEQKPAEWSEEDEKLLDFWLDVIDRNDWRMDEDFCKASREFINRLKSLRPQPHWKPSKEQMKALNTTINLSNYGIDIERKNILLSLYEQLKKL